MANGISKIVLAFGLGWVLFFVFLIWAFLFCFFLFFFHSILPGIVVKRVALCSVEGPRDVLVSRKRRKGPHTSVLGPMSPREQKTFMVRTSCITRLCSLERYPSADTLCDTHLPKQIREPKDDELETSQSLVAGLL